MKSKKIYIKGMHCPSCEIYIEKELKNIPEIKAIKSNHIEQSVTFESEIAEHTVIDRINPMIKGNGYFAQTDAPKKSVNIRELAFSFLIALGIFLLFILLQKARILPEVTMKQNTLGMAFTLGLTASISSCMVVVGGLILSLSATYKKVSSLAYFHFARIISFFLLGGVLGLVGQIFTFGKSFNFITGIILFVVMTLMGMNLLEIFPIFKKIQIKLPKTLVGEKMTNVSSPILLGILTFFLPCGFTQSMQIVAMSTANFKDAALIMLIFSLGTFPVLALLSFGVKSIRNRFKSALFLKTVGFLVLMFAVYNLVSLLISVGIITFIY